MNHKPNIHKPEIQLQHGTLKKVDLLVMSPIPGIIIGDLWAADHNIKCSVFVTPDINIMR